MERSDEAVPSNGLCRLRLVFDRMYSVFDRSQLVSSSSVLAAAHAEQFCRGGRQYARSSTPVLSTLVLGAAPLAATGVMGGSYRSALSHSASEAFPNRAQLRDDPDTWSPLALFW